MTVPEIPDVDALLAQVQRQQQEVERIQRSVEAMEVIGACRGDDVRFTLRGNGQFTAVDIDPQALRQNDAHQLEELIVEAANDAMQKLTAASKARFAPIIDAAGSAG